MERIAFGSHKRYTLCSVENERGDVVEKRRIERERGAIREYLEHFATGTPVLEVGDVSRFSRPQQLAAYAGTTPRVYSSGGRIRNCRCKER